MKSAPKQKQRSTKLLFLDGLRGLAALYVMIGHARWLLWEGFEDYSKHPEAYTFFDKVLVYGFSLFRYGHEVVLFFFVLSGFVIHLKYARSFQTGFRLPIDYRDYMWKRFRRIYPPFLVALGLTALLDILGRYFHLSIYFGETNNQLVNTSIGSPDLTLKTFFGSLLFLYKNYFPVFGSNGPAWSLKYEWWFYVLFPIFLSIGRRNIWYPTAAIILLFCASFFPGLWPEKLLPDVFSMMITWWMGVILAEIYCNRIKLKLQVASFPLATILLYFVPSQFASVWNDLIMGFFFFGLLALLLSMKENNQIKTLLGKLKILGDFSYTLYITHFPILVFFAGWVFLKNGNDQPTHFGYVLAGILITIGISYLLHFVTEVPFISKRETKTVNQKSEIKVLENQNEMRRSG
jgi:peptidoglycan/LPS O-acetylase OafA/YrhL